MSPDTLPIGTTANGGTQPSSTVAGLGGAGSGTTLVALAQSIWDNTTLGAVLIYGAPAITVMAGVLIYYLQVYVSSVAERRKHKDWLRRVASARMTLEQQLDSPNLSAQAKKRIREKLERLEVAVADQQVQRVGQLVEKQDTASVQPHGSASDGRRRSATGETA